MWSVHNDYGFTTTASYQSVRAQSGSFLATVYKRGNAKHVYLDVLWLKERP